MRRGLALIFSMTMIFVCAVGCSSQKDGIEIKDGQFAATSSEIVEFLNKQIDPEDIDQLPDRFKIKDEKNERTETLDLKKTTEINFIVDKESGYVKRIEFVAFNISDSIKEAVKQLIYYAGLASSQLNPEEDTDKLRKENDFSHINEYKTDVYEDDQMKYELMTGANGYLKFTMTPVKK